jgi:hypothetical protein
MATLTQPYMHQRDVAVSLARARLAQQRIAAAISQELGAMANGGVLPDTPSRS